MPVAFEHKPCATYSNAQSSVPPTHERYKQCITTSGTFIRSHSDCPSPCCASMRGLLQSACRMVHPGRLVSITISPTSLFLFSCTSTRTKLASSTGRRANMQCSPLQCHADTQVVTICFRRSVQSAQLVAVSIEPIKQSCQPHARRLVISV